MKLGIMQPYFFPYIGYFQLIKAIDKWVIFDSVQYIRHGWINRNRILKPCAKDWQYIGIRVKKHSRETQIKDILIVNRHEWKQKIFAQLEHYKKKSPNYYSTVSFLEKSFDYDSDSIVDINIHLLGCICEYLNIPFFYCKSSELILDDMAIQKPSDWALYVSKQLGASSYINPPKGRSIFDKNKFIELGIDISILNPILINYYPKKYNFIPALSIIDVMMFCNKSQIIKMLDDCVIEPL